MRHQTGPGSVHAISVSRWQRDTDCLFFCQDLHLIKLQGPECLLLLLKERLRVITISWYWTITILCLLFNCINISEDAAEDQMRLLIWSRDCVGNKMDHLQIFMSDNYFNILKWAKNWQFAGAAEWRKKRSNKRLRNGECKCIIVLRYCYHCQTPIVSMIDGPWSPWVTVAPGPTGQSGQHQFSFIIWPTWSTVNMEIITSSGLCRYFTALTILLWHFMSFGRHDRMFWYYTRH